MTQLNLFTELSNEAQNPRLRGCSVGGSVSYRQRFGLDNPPKGTVLKLKYMQGLSWYLHWEECTDGEDIIQGWFGTASKARKYASENNWLVKS
jgi:hypothetical protein